MEKFCAIVHFAIMDSVLAVEFHSENIKIILQSMFTSIVLALQIRTDRGFVSLRDPVKMLRILV